MINFCTLNYLKEGNKKQRRAYDILEQNKIFKKIKLYQPILVGTIPIEIDLDNSDLDIICGAQNLEQFERYIRLHFSTFEGFKLSRNEQTNYVVANFFINEFEIEIFAQSLQPIKQNGYRHMIIENRLLELGGEQFKKKVIELKQSGLKTEPAFAHLLRLAGDPYQALLDLECVSDEQLSKLIAQV